MQVIICDDRTEDRTILLDYCSRYAKENFFPIAALDLKNAGMLLSTPESRNADVLFLDIYMEGASGIDAARILRGKGFNGAIVYTTTSLEHYAEGFDTEASHYLLKPVSWISFCEAMRRVRSRMSLPSKRIAVTSGRTAIHVDVSNIQYIEVFGHKTVVHTTKGELAASQSLAAIEKELGGTPFLRCYRYFVVNMDYVQRMNESSFIMKDGQEIPLSRDRKAAIKKIYMNYIFQQLDK